MEWRVSLRTTFDDVADLYDRARPAYPDAVFDDLATLTGLPEGGRVLELGSGTGQATLPLAERGYRIIGVELGERLAAIAQRKLIDFPNVQLAIGPFEEWDHGDVRFDAFVAFTSFHWLDPTSRYQRVARMLRDNGSLAIVETSHVRRERGNSFWVEVQQDYDAVVPSDDNRPPPHPDEVGDLSEEIDASGLFHQAAVRRHLFDVMYNADEYVAVLGTYSGHIALDPGVREELLARIRRRVETQPSRTVTKTYLATLNVAQLR